MTGRVNRACDGCRFRKVRCGGKHPCPQCSHLNLTCVFSEPTVKRKPPVRGRLVAQLRDKANGAALGKPAQTASSPSAASASTLSPTGTRSCGDRDLPSPYDHATSSSNGADSYTQEFFSELLPKFEQLVYPMNPIIPPSEIQEAIDNMHDSYEDAALVYAYAAVTVNLTQTSWMLNGDTAAQMTDLMQRCLKAHRMVDLHHATDGPWLGEVHVSIKRIMTCIFMEICLMAFKRTARSFLLLREAISMLETMNIPEYSQVMPDLEPSEISRRQRVYWEAYIHERFMTMTTGYPSILRPLEGGVAMRDPTIPPNIDVGFSCLIHLFLTIDDSFITFWQVQHTPSAQPTLPNETMTAQWIESKQAELDRDEVSAVRAEQDLISRSNMRLTELQHCDLYITRLWMRTLIWQLALFRGLLRSAPPQTAHQGLSLHFPARRLSSELRSLMSRLESVASIAMHGSGILQKLFEITSTVADVLALPLGAGQTQEDVRVQMEDFVYLVKFLFSFERIRKEQRGYLREKLEVLQRMYTVVDFREVAAVSPE